MARQQGEYLPVIAFGNIKLLETYQDELEARFKSREVPANPGCFALSEPYEGFVLIIHDLCPARYVNDAKERQGVTKNVQFHQHPDPRSLYYDPEKGFQLFLRLQATRDIAPNEELCCAYGTNFWDATARNVKGIDERMKEAKTIETQLEDEEQEEEEKEEAERKKEEEREKKEKEEQEKAKKKGKKKPAAKVVEDVEEETKKERTVDLDEDDDTDIEPAPTPTPTPTKQTPQKRFIMFIDVHFFFQCNLTCCLLGQHPTRQTSIQRKQKRQKNKKILTQKTSQSQLLQTSKRLLRTSKQHKQELMKKRRKQNRGSQQDMSCQQLPSKQEFAFGLFYKLLLCYFSPFCLH